MFILYVSGTYMPAAGGAEISMYTLLRCLAERGHRVSVFTSEIVPTTPAYGRDVGLDVHQVETAQLNRALTEFCEGKAVDLVATQNLWADHAISYCRKVGLPSVYFARAADGRLDLSKGGTHEPDYVIANSQSVAAFVRDVWGREAPVVRSIVLLKDYGATAGSRSHITMINPISTHKGGEMFRSIAHALRERVFLAIEGWGHLRTGDFWNMQLLRDLASGLGSSDVWIPQDVDLSALDNVTVWKSTSDMRRVYGETRLLLIPSTSVESIPRVAIEAMSNGIPVIGSAVGGISEILSSTGVLVRDHKNVSAWIDAIRDLDDSVRYAQVSEASVAYVRSLDYSSEVSRCISLFNEVIDTFRSHRQS